MRVRRPSFNCPYGTTWFLLTSGPSDESLGYYQRPLRGQATVKSPSALAIHSLTVSLGIQQLSVVEHFTDQRVAFAVAALRVFRTAGNQFDRQSKIEPR